MSGSSIPGAIDALVAHAQAVVATVPGAAAYDGPRRTSTAQTYFAIGYAAGSAEGGSTKLADLGLSQDAESYAISCQASTWAGNGEFKPLRDQAFALVDALAARVAADPSLGDVVMSALVSETVDYRATVEAGKPTVVVPFTVQIEAMRRNTP